MTWPRSAVVVSLGFFALVAQTLLFRDFLTAFEGHELGVGSFFGSWLFAVGVGALAGRAKRVHEALNRFPFELLALSYLPAFLLQQFLVAQARQWTGVAAYEIFPLDRMLAASFLVNSPVSLTTGFLFALACRWAAEKHSLPVSRVYIEETLGSFAGGITVTCLLAAGRPGEEAAIFAMFTLAAASGGSLLASRQEKGSDPFGAQHPSGRSDKRRLPPFPAADRRAHYFIPPLVLAAIAVTLLGTGGADAWSLHNRKAAWKQLLPADEFLGQFNTAQASYLYGQREDQFQVVSWGGVSEVLPDAERGSAIVALTLAQHPQARRILVVGPGSLAVCRQFLQIPQMQRVVWLHPDPEYPAALLRALPKQRSEELIRLEVPGRDVLAFLRDSPRQFDLVILNLPDATTLAVNRYWTSEFLASVKASLEQGGVVCTRISGAANYLGGELVYLGASALCTIESVFRNVVLKAGDESWLIASDGDSLSGLPALLRDRFAAIPEAAKRYPPEGLFSLYQPDRAEYQLQKYREAIASRGAPLLVNSDSRPKAMLFGMLLALRRAEFLSLAEHLPTALAASPWIAPCPLVIYGVLRFVFLVAGRRRTARHNAGPIQLFDGGFLIFSTGMAGMALSTVLMFLYQSRFGSLYLYVGLIASLFMLGSCLGGLAGQWLAVGPWGESRRLPAACIAAQVLAIVLMLGASRSAGQNMYAVFFAMGGFFVGVYFPLVAGWLRRGGRSPLVSGSLLEMLDHLGGAAGAVLASWLLLPLLGERFTLAVLGLVAAVNLVPCVAPAPIHLAVPNVHPFNRWARPAAYSMFGVAAFALAASQIVWAVQAGGDETRLLVAAREMAPDAELMEKRVELPGGAGATYFEVRGSEGVEEFIFSTGPFCSDVYGYGGPIVLAAYVQRDGTLRDLRILRSQETPAYVDGLRGKWLAALPGHDIFQPSPIQGVDAVSGATMTSEAILRTLEESGRGFAAAVLGQRLDKDAPRPNRWIPTREFWLLGWMLIMALVLRRRPERMQRRVLLACSLLLTGAWLNLQYSTHHVMSLLSLRIPTQWFGGPCLLIVGVPLLAVWFGNIYCGYVCPFGAAQELFGDTRPARLTFDPGKRVWGYGRSLKYALLFLLVLVFAATRDFAVLSADPLTTLFSRLWDWPTLTLAGVVLGLSFPFRRFWCRSLCPAGAFLAMVGGLRLGRLWMPRVDPVRCDLGVRTKSELDCLSCDRCRHEAV